LRKHVNRHTLHEHFGERLGDCWAKQAETGSKAPYDSHKH
jgi:hypothetical protein